jgi:hypothetical protein
LQINSDVNRPEGVIQKKKKKKKKKKTFEHFYIHAVSIVKEITYLGAKSHV